jgi:hypothetical protein
LSRSDSVADIFEALEIDQAVRVGTFPAKAEPVPFLCSLPSSYQAVVKQPLRFTSSKLLSIVYIDFKAANTILRCDVKNTY